MLNISLSRLFLNYFFGKILSPMLIKEAIQKVAKELKKESNIEFQDPIILQGYSEDLSEKDIRKAMAVISVVSEVLLELQ